jgi:hypothetical protein
MCKLNWPCGKCWKETPDLPADKPVRLLASNNEDHHRSDCLHGAARIDSLSPRNFAIPTIDVGYPDHETITARVHA